MIRNLLIAFFITFGAVSFAHAQEPNCEELKLACEQKDALGERGQGNCRRYREACEEHRRGSPYCNDLRAACLHKDQLGERGQGNCRRYREECH